jgi:putative transposase
MKSACAALGLNRATAYRLQGPKPSIMQGPRKAQTRRIPDSQRTEVLALLDSERFVDQPPREAYAALLSEGTYGVRCIESSTSEHR